MWRVACGVGNFHARNVDIPTMVLYPEGGVSAIQRAQMTSTPLDSTHTIGVEADETVHNRFIVPRLASHESFEVLLTLGT